VREEDAVTLREVLEPLSFEEFVNRYLGKRYLLARGRPGRYANVLPWHELNEALRHVRPHGRVNLVQKGRQVPLESFLTSTREVETAWIKARQAEALLAAGASIMVAQVDELCDGVQELAESCEGLLRIPVGVNMYAGWGTDHAFDLHWDGHDTLILQVSGRKRWQVYEPTLLHPLSGRNEKPQKPAAEPVWEGVLEDGDLLYMPRGWWHVACPLDEQTLHLTVGLQHRTGADLLKWAAAEARRELNTRMDLPHLQGRDDRTAYAAKLCEVMANVLTDDVVERFMRAMDEEIPIRPRFGLPLSVTGQVTAIGMDTHLRLASGSRLHLAYSSDGRTLTFKAGQTQWNCDASLAPAITALSGTRPTTLRSMCAQLDPVHQPSLRAFVVAMASGGAIWAEAPRRIADDSTNYREVVGSGKSVSGE
jgi:ribosomal protein L16 Arg81 hydroxylase